MSRPAGPGRSRSATAPPMRPRRRGSMSYLIWPLLLLMVGLILLVTEAFIPSGGLIGLLALGCLGVSLYQAFNVPDAPYLGWKFLVAELLLIPAAMVLAVQLWPKTPLAKRIFLPPPSAEDGRARLPEAPARPSGRRVRPGDDPAPPLGARRLRRPTPRRARRGGADPRRLARPRHPDPFRRARRPPARDEGAGGSGRLNRNDSTPPPGP